MRIGLLILGVTSLLLGLIGIFLPLMPTAPFVILAAYCFQRSSPKLHHWLTHQPLLGPILRDWDENRVIRKQNKILAIVGLWISLSWPLSRSYIPLWAKLIALIVGLSVSIFIIRQKSSP